MHCGDLIDERLALGRGQLVRVGNGLGGGAAVLAGQVAGLRDLPDGQKGGFIEVQPAAGGNGVHRLHEASTGIAVAGPKSGPKGEGMPRLALRRAARKLDGL